jgi:acyl-CoA thioester hydrolase
MGRIKLVMPEKILTTVSIPVRITDLNYGNHVGNDSLVSILHEARVLWLNSHNFSELDVDGTSLIMGDLAVEFVNESFYGDKLIVTLAAGEVTGVSFELFYAVHCFRNEKNFIIARAKTGMVCYDYKLKKVTAVTEKLRKILTN